MFKSSNFSLGNNNNDENENNDNNNEDDNSNQKDKIHLEKIKVSKINYTRKAPWYKTLHNATPPLGIKFQSNYINNPANASVDLKFANQTTEIIM